MSAAAFNPRDGVQAPIPAGLPLQSLGVDLKDIWALEYSQSADCLHLRLFIDVLRINYCRFLNQGRTGDWVIIGLFHSQEACNEFADRLLEQKKTWGLSTLTVDDLLRRISP